MVATVLTVYGIETFVTDVYSQLHHQHVATVLTVYGIETGAQSGGAGSVSTPVATVLTVYGIETCCSHDNISFLYKCCNSTYRLRY